MNIDRIKLRVPINETIHIPNINYYENLLNTNSKFDKAYYQKLILSIKKQKNYATPNQFHTLQKLKGGIQESVPSDHFFQRKEERGTITDITLPELAYVGYDKEDTKNKLIDVIQKELNSRLKTATTKDLSVSFKNHVILKILKPVLINKSSEYNIKTHYKQTDKNGNLIEGSGYLYYLIVEENELVTLMITKTEEDTDEYIISRAKNHFERKHRTDSDKPFMVISRPDFKIDIEQLHGKEKELQLKEPPKDDTVPYIPRTDYRVGVKFVHKTYGEGTIVKTSSGVKGQGDANGRVDWVDVDFGGKGYLTKDKKHTTVRRISPVFTKVYFDTHRKT